MPGDCCARTGRGPAFQGLFRPGGAEGRECRRTFPATKTSQFFRVSAMGVLYTYSMRSRKTGAREPGQPETPRAFFSKTPPFLLSLLLLVCAGAAPLGAISAQGDYQLDFYSVGAPGGSLSSGGEYSSRGVLAQSVLPPNEGFRRGGEYSDRAGFYNPPHFTYQGALAAYLSFPAGNARLTLPAGSVGKAAFDIVLNKEARSSPLSIDPGEIENANSRIYTNEGAWALPLEGNITETYIFDEQDPWDAPLNVPGALSLMYRDADGDGIIDGSNPPVRADTARVWALDRDRDMWVKLPPSSIDPAARSITIPFMAPGVYAILGTLDESVKDAYAFPVPFRPNGPNAGFGAGRTGTAADGITFANLPQQGSIEIYTLDGLFVRKLAIQENLVPPEEMSWDVKNSAGEKVRSDVYIWRVVSGTNVKTGKLMIIW